jgi:hypothetical protein
MSGHCTAIRPETANLVDEVDKRRLLARLEIHVPSDAKLFEVAAHLLGHPVDLRPVAHDQTTWAMVSFFYLSLPTNTTL